MAVKLIVTAVPRKRLDVAPTPVESLESVGVACGPATDCQA